MATRRRRAGAYPTRSKGSVGSGDSSSYSPAAFNPQDVLSESSPSGATGGGGAINITNINTAIAQAIAGSPGATQGATVTAGGMQMMMQMGMMMGGGSASPY